MNCVYCGKKIYPEAPFCPHCGKPNEQRMQLEHRVAAFDKGYGQANEEVRQAVRRKNRFIGKLVVLIFLFLVTVLSFFLLGNVYLFYSVARERAVQEQIDSLVDEIDGYLDAQDYFGLNAWFVHRGNDQYVIYDEAPSYYLVIQLTRSYCETMMDFMEYRRELLNAAQALETGGYYYDSRPAKARSLRDSLENFYERRTNEDIWYGAQERLDAVEQMQRNLEALLMAWFGIPEQEISRLQTMSQGAREVLFEQYIQAPVDALTEVE